MISTGIPQCNLVACKTLSESGGVFMFSCNWWAGNVISLECFALPLMTLKICHFSIRVIQFLVQAKEVGGGEGGDQPPSSDSIFTAAPVAEA